MKIASERQSSSHHARDGFVPRHDLLIPPKTIKIFLIKSIILILFLTCGYEGSQTVKV